MEQRTDDLMPSAYSGSRINRRQVLYYGLAGMVPLAVSFLPAFAGGTANASPDAQTWGRSSFTMFRLEGDLHFTLATLEAIRQKLLEALKQKQPPQDYAHLIREIESGNAAPMIFADRASIGRWRLIYRDDRLFLERQQIQPNVPVRLSYIASLEWQDGQWHVRSINIKAIIGR